MRLATVKIDGTTEAVRVEGERLLLLGASDVGAYLRTDVDQTRAGEDVTARVESWTQPVLNPGKIICVGLNYRRHILEMGRDLPTHPTLFTKFADTLTGPYDSIEIPSISSQVDWEAELCVVIGRRAKNVSSYEALDAVLGYTVANDVSMRDWQNRTTQWTQGKVFERTTPVGPSVLSSDELPRGASGLTISCEVDGEIVQHDNTADLLFSVEDLIAYISSIVTLGPGDLILTGTPGGVGAGSTPPRYLHPGSQMTTRISEIGTLTNTFAEPSMG